MTEIAIVVTVGGFVVAGVVGILSFRLAVDVLLPEDVRSKIRRRETDRANGQG